MHGLTPAGYYQIQVASPWDKFITKINQNSFGELWINKDFESEKGLSLQTEHEYQIFITIEEKSLA